MKTINKIALITVFTLMTVMVVLAQTNAPPVVVGGNEFGMAAAWNALVVALVPLAIAAVKAGANKVGIQLSSTLWPLLAPFLGVLANWIMSKAGLLPTSGWALGAALGAAGVGLREVVDQLKQYFTPPPTGGGNPLPSP